MKKSIFTIETIHDNSDGSGTVVQFMNIPDTCVAIYKNSSDEILLVKQFRPVFNDYLIEVPGGSQEENETIEAAAKREFLEETNLVAKNVTPIISMALSVGASNEKVHIFRVDSLDDGGSCRPEDGLKIFWINLKVAIQMIRSGEIVDAKTIVAIQNYSS